MIGRKNCHNLFFLLQMVKNKMLTLLVSAFVHCWLCWCTTYFPYIDFLLKWGSARCSKMDGQGLNVYKVVCWYRFGETSVFRLHVPLGRKWVPSHWCWWCPKVFMITWTATLNLGVSKGRGHYTGTMCLSLVWLLRPSRCWVWSIYNPTEPQVTTM